MHAYVFVVGSLFQMVRTALSFTMIRRPVAFPLQIYQRMTFKEKSLWHIKPEYGIICVETRSSD